MATSTTDQDTLAILGGVPAVQNRDATLTAWPIVTEEDENAVLEVLRNRSMSETYVTRQFENEFAAWQKTEFALGFNTGTAAIHTAMFACGVGVGDEIICPSLTYWASALQCFSLGATVVFAEVDPYSLCIDPRDIEYRISPRTKAIVVVHYAGYPCDMHAIMEIAKRHDLKVIEDVSHAQGGHYKGRRLGGIGDVGAMSLMTGKSFAIGEAGMLVTDDREIYERAVAFGHYERFNEGVQTDALKPFAGLPLGGVKYRMHQMSSAMGRVQLKYYDERCAEINKAMNYFWDLLGDVPGIRRRQVEDAGSDMAGWYHPLAHYVPEELGGLPVGRFAAAVRAEGTICRAGCNFPLHLHPVLSDCDIYGHGAPTRIASVPEDVRQHEGSLPVTEGINSRICTIPWFKHYRPSAIEEHAKAFRKVAALHELLLDDARSNGAHEVEMGALSFSQQNAALA
jgi:dTDP-4-amino-4,6-dideoxygalactose transaminase